MLRKTPRTLSLATLMAAASTAYVIASCAESESAPHLPVEDAGHADASAPLPAVRRCKPGEWCPVELPPEPVSLNAIWGSASNDVWIVGAPAVVLHWDGKELARTRIETPLPLAGVWGSGPGDVWTFGSTKWIWHSDGAGALDAGWSRSTGAEVDSGTGMDPLGHPTPILGMWGSSPSDVWAVGASLVGFDLMTRLPTVYHCDGWRSGAPQWRASGIPIPEPPYFDSATYNAICGGAATGVWVVGDGGKTRFTAGWRGDHAEWKAINTDTSRNLNAVWCGPDGDVWAAGESGLMRRYTRGDGGDYVDLAVETPTTESIRALWGLAADDVWAVGDAGAILHWDGTAWKVADGALRSVTTEDLLAIWGSAKNDIWIAGRNILLHHGEMPESKAP